MKNNMYYDLSKVDSYRQPIKMIVGGEGIGKTYSIKSKYLAIREKQDIQIRWYTRYDIDCDKSLVEKWIEDVPPNPHLSIGSREILYDGQPFVEFDAISNAFSGKGRPYPKVVACVFDEFILPKKGRYLSNEMAFFKRWTQSVFRLRPVRWYLLANALSFDNPYFNYFEIKKEPNQEFFSTSEVVVHYAPPSSNYAKAFVNSDYGRIFRKDESTVEYGLKGEFYFDSTSHISSKYPKSEFVWNIKAKGETYGVWRSDMSGMLLWIGKAIKGQKTVTFDKREIDIGVVYLPALLDIFTQLYTSNSLWFDKLSTKNVILESIKCL